jgi:hypothetical protein
MALSTCVINKNGSGLQIVGYSNNGAASTSDLTITNPNGVKVFANGNTVTIDPENIAPFIFEQTTNGKNKVVTINGTDTSAYTAAQIVTALNNLMVGGFSTGLPVTSSSIVIMSLTTNATPATYTAFSSQACVAIDVTNATGGDVTYKRGGTGNAMTIIDGQSRTISGITNANQISFAAAAGAVVLCAEAITV